MIELEKVEKSFCQSGHSCVLASYAIVANYFTGFSVKEFFKDYCLHFQVPVTADDPEAGYNGHFHDELKRRNCSGYELIADLHNNALENCFAKTRDVINATLFGGKGEHPDRLIPMLIHLSSFLNVTYPNGPEFHSITVFASGHTLYCRDTRHLSFFHVPDLQSIPSPVSLTGPQDYVLFTEKKRP